MVSCIVAPLLEICQQMPDEKQYVTTKNSENIGEHLRNMFLISPLIRKTNISPVLRMTSYTSKGILTTAVQIEVQKVSGGFYRMHYWAPGRAVCCAPSKIYLRCKSRYCGINTALKEVSCCSLTWPILYFTHFTNKFVFCVLLFN